MIRGLTPRQTDLLERYDSGTLLEELNGAIAAWGHGRLRSEAGEHLDIGGSTGGGSRRIIDGWTPPDWREFLEHADMVGGFMRRASPKKR